MAPGEIEVPLPTVGYVHTSVITEPMQRISSIIYQIQSFEGGNRNQPQPPEQHPNPWPFVAITGFIWRMLDHAGAVLDSGDIVTGIGKAASSWSLADLTGWIAINAVILVITGVWLVHPIQKVVAAVRLAISRVRLPLIGSRNG